MNISLTHIEIGSGKPLIILHGLFGSARNWASIARSFGQPPFPGPTWRVITPDLRNHGSSPWSQEMTYAAMADDIRRMMLDQGIPSAPVIGHSMGGKVAMTLALQSPEMVERLIVVDIAPIPYNPVLRAYAEAMRRIDTSVLVSRAAADEQLSGMVHEPAIRGFLLQNLVREDGHWRWRINLDVVSVALDEICGTAGMTGAVPYKRPSLFLRGERSDYVRSPAEAAIYALFPQAEIATIIGAGHWLHAEQPQAFLDAVSAWLLKTAP